MFNPNNFKVETPKIVNSLFEIDNGQLAVLFESGVVEKLNLYVGDSSSYTPKGLEWYESYVDGEIILSHQFWEILKYDSSSDYYEDCRRESSTGWVERQLLETMPERWHALITKSFN